MKGKVEEKIDVKVEENKDVKAEVVIRNREKEYAKHTLIVIIVLAVVITGIVLAIKFLKKEPASIQLYNEAGEPLGSYSEGSNITVPTKKGYSTIWISESGQTYSSLSDALSSGESSVKQSFSPIEYTVTLYLTGGHLDEDLGFTKHEAAEGLGELGDYYTRTYTIEDEDFDLPALTRSTNTQATKKGNTFYFWSNVNYIGTNYTVDNLKATEIKTISTQEASDIVLYAAWKAVMCTVHVFDVDGTLMFFEEHQEASILSEEAFRTKVLSQAPAGYDFVGFCADSKLNTPFDFSQEINHQTTAIYTKWTALPYTITYKDVDDTTLDTVTFRTKEDIAFFNYLDIIPVGKTFEYWTLDGNEFTLTQMPPQDLVLKASVVDTPYTITWVVDDGSSESQVYHYGNEPQAPATLNLDKAEDEGYTYVFDGWSPALTSVSEDKTYTATYRQIIKRFTYSFEVRDQAYGSTTKVDYNSDIVYPAVDPADYEEEGYHYSFDKWVLKGTDTTPTKLTKDMVIVAKFNSQILSYSIRWVDKDEQTIQVRDANNQLVDSLTYEYGTIVDLSKAYSEEIATYETHVDDKTRVFTFKGWSIGNILQNSNNYRLVGDTVVYAIYEDDSDKFYYELRTETGDIISTNNSCYVGEADALYTLLSSIVRTKPADNTYTYEFDGWNYDNNGVPTKVEDATPLDLAKNEEIILTERFIAHYIEYIITWDLDNGSPTIVATYHYNDTLHPETDLAAHSITSVTKESTISTTFTFVRWDYESNVVTKNATYIALYEETPRQYTYKFFINNDDEEPYVVNSINYEKEIPTPADPTKAATAQYTYTFVGWYENVNDEDTKFVDGTKINKDVNYYAKFNRTTNKYTYTFYDEDETTILLQETVDYGTIVNAPVNPTKDSTDQYDYSFDIWTTLTGDPYVDGQELVANVSYKATYTQTTRKYTYTFHSESSVFATDELEYGEELVISTIGTPTKAADANRYTYVFVAWYSNSELTGDPVGESIEITKNVDLYAKYNPVPIEHTYTFVTGEGASTVPAITAGYNETITAPTAPEKDYYDFVGWDKDIPSKMGEADDTFTAVWTPTVYTVTYNLNGGSATSNPDSYTVESNAASLALANDSTKVGYTLAGWKYEGEVITSIPVAYEDITIDAYFTANTYTITYVPQKEDVTIANSTKDVTYDSAYGALETPSKHGYNFLGWYLDSECTAQNKITSTTIVKITEDSDVYAKWELVPYYVYAYVGDTHVETFTFDVEHSVTLTNYTNNGEYAFDHWYLEDVNDPSIAISSFTPVTTYSDTTGDIITNVYAIVKPVDLTISSTSKDTVTGYTGSNSHVIIPRVWDGVEITKIADNAFAKNNTITTVDTTFITEIGNSAFKRCKNLANVDLSNVETIGEDAFTYCTFTSVDLSSATTIGEAAFASSSVTEITISTELTSLGEDAFLGCNITTIHYNGTQEQFEALIVNNDNLSWDLVK